MCSSSKKHAQCNSNTRLTHSYLACRKVHAHNGKRENEHIAQMHALSMSIFQHTCNRDWCIPVSIFLAITHRQKIWWYTLLQSRTRMPSLENWDRFSLVLIKQCLYSVQRRAHVCVTLLGSLFTTPHCRLPLPIVVYHSPLSFTTPHCRLPLPIVVYHSPLSFTTPHCRSDPYLTIYYCTRCLTYIVIAAKHAIPKPPYALLNVHSASVVVRDAYR